MNCSAEPNCPGKVVARGLCGKHYQRFKKHGDPLVVNSSSPPAVHVGERYGRLVVTAPAGTNRHGQRRYEVRCDCGTVKVVVGYPLTQRTTESCGCLHRETFHRRTHGRSGTPEHRIWKNMIPRCTNPNNQDWRFY